MTNFNDVWQVILDDNARPLIGKIEFCEPNTTTLKEIYDDTEQVTENPMYVNKRTTHQILLGEGDYTVRYYRYIGNGNMESDNNEGSWFNYKTELVKGSVSSSGTGSNAMVNTIAELKNVVPSDGDVVSVVGYNDKFDCPRRDYVWIANSLAEDDGGYHIKSSKTTTGVWELKVPGSYIDVRWFGDIPDSTYNPSSGSQTSSIGQRSAAADIANVLGKDLYFPRGNYIFDGTNTINVSKDIICDNGVKFVVKSGTTGTKIICHELHRCDKTPLFISNSIETQLGGYELNADWIKLSWFSASTVNANGARVGYILDSTTKTTPMSLSNCTLDVQAKNSTFSLNLDNVNVISNHLLTGSVEVAHMNINQSWFEYDYDLSDLIVGQGCDVKLADCNDANSYIKLKNKCVKYDYGDLGEQTIYNADVYSGGTIENFYGSITLKNAGNYEIHNANVTINGVNSTTTLNLIDCWTFLGGTYSVCGGLELRRGSLNGSSPLQVLSSGNFGIYDADIGIYLKLFGLSGYTIDNCKIYNTIQIIGHSNFYIINNIFGTNSKIEYTGDANGMYGTFKNNIIHYDSLGWHYSSNIANTIVGIVWSGNHSDMTNHFITLDRTNFKARDIEHTYVYKDNTGLYTVQQEWTTATTGKVRNGMTSSVDSNTICYLAAIRGSTSSLWDGLWWLSIGYKSEGTMTGKDIKPVIFAVGTIVRPVLDISVFTYDNYDDYLTINGRDYVIWTTPTTEASLELISNYTWQLYSGASNAFRCHGEGNLSGTPLPDKTLNFKITVRNERFI